MYTRSRFVCLSTILCLSATLLFSQEQTPTTPKPIDQHSFWDVPLVRFLESLMSPSQPAAAPAAPKLVASGDGCPVAPLDAIDDPAAQQLEAASLSGAAGETVDVAGMNPEAAGALTTFEKKVAAVGGSIVLKSAYRPAAYQQHLQNVWYKWMTELRNNHNPDCQDLRTQVQTEFLRHHLIETQHPVSVSDHTRGLAFDATVSLPAHAHIGRFHVSLDSLARLAGLLRPAIAADPVHFKFVGLTSARVHYARALHTPVRVRYASATRRPSRTRAHRNA